MPLPMPRSVICSPSHMMNTLPVVSVSMVISMKPTPGLVTKAVPPVTVERSRLSAMPKEATCRAQFTPGGRLLADGDPR